MTAGEELNQDEGNGASQRNRQAVHEPEPVLTVPIGQEEGKPDGIEKEQV